MRAYHIYDQIGMVGIQAANNKNDAVHFFSHWTRIKPFGKRIPIVGKLVAYDILKDEVPHTWEN